jgi:hypothetical protein
MAQQQLNLSTAMRGMGMGLFAGAMVSLLRLRSSAT